MTSQTFTVSNFRKSLGAVSLLVILLFPDGLLFAQKGVVQGRVSDAQSSETLVGVHVIADSLTGITTDAAGEYRLTLNAGKHILKFRFIGYGELNKQIELLSGDTLRLDVSLQIKKVDLEAAVVTAGKFRQRLSDITVSMEIIQPEFIENTNTINIETAIGQMPGIDVLDGQASIRGGSGYSFGAGSRVQLLVDEVPMLTADVNEVKWNFLPVEHIERVEILKGASSVLYGSSALNGVINILTTWPGEKPETTINLFGGMYTQPQNQNMSWWWEGLPLFGGANFSTAHKLGNVDLVVGGNAYTDEGYREENDEHRIRGNVKIRHRPSGVEGLTYGLNASLQTQRNSDFLIWQDADSGAFLQREGSAVPTRAYRFHADPWVTYYDQRGNRHSLKTRYYAVDNRFPGDPEKDNGSALMFGDYQFHRTFFEKLNITTGFTGIYGITNAELFGDHHNTNIALYAQADYQVIQPLSLSLGVRWERYTLDDTDRESSPVVRAGMNYKVARATFLRASFGQGYRFPSIAEKYTATTIGSLNVFPNPDLESETGWSAEAGVKQGFQLGTWSGFLDLAGYWTEYNNMIEFTFGVWLEDSTQIPGLENLGFKSLNVGKARINGIDLNVNAVGSIGSVPVVLFAGYTYMNPVDLSSDTLENNMLKYRFNHSFKGDIEINPGKFTAGLNFRFTSFMERVDEAFEEQILGQEIFPGLKDYRLENARGAWFFDLRMGYQINRSIRLMALVKNLFNEEAMGRPGDILPPRNVTLQVRVTF